jgi:hypothetical protein
VTAPASGQITGTGISCPGDCSQAFSWTETCYDFGQARTCEESGVDEPLLTASGGPGGYSPNWSGCTSVASQQRKVHMNAAQGVSVAWVDTTAPSVWFASAPAKAGAATQFVAGAADNSGAIAKVDFYVDDVLRAADTSAPFAATVDVGLYADGSAHVLKAVAQDLTGNRSTAATHSFTVDRSTALSGVSSVPPYVTTAPAVAFSEQADATVTCTTRLGADVKGTTASCTAPYTAQLGPGATDGQYTIELRAADDVGNTATVTRSFTLDRGAPNLAIGAPAAGAIVGGRFTPSLTVADGFTPDGHNAVACRIDARAFRSCAALRAADGPHTLTVRAVDLAGNSVSRAVAFTYDATAPVVAITRGPAEGSVVYARSASFRFATRDLTAAKTSCKLDDGPYTRCGGGRDLTGLALGIHAFFVRAVDAAGHVTEVRRRFTVSELPTRDDEGPSRIEARVSTFWALFDNETRVKRLTVLHLPAGATVTLECKGKRCPFERAVLQAERSKLRLGPKFKRRKLRARTRITITVAKDGMIGETFRYTIRAGKFPKLRKI